MRYEKGHRDATRARIIEIASRRLRRDGVEAVGIASLMAEAGLTHGGFYAHFASKEDLVRAALGDAMQRGQDRLGEAAAQDGLEGIIRYYLRPRHRDEPERGCAAASLAAEVARHPEATRSTLADPVEDRVALIAECLPAGDPAERRRRAIGIFASLMGTLQLARLAPDPALSDEILAGGAAAARALAGGAGQV
ncbi:TetR/AcrR family transcriptional regulator [Roseomonas hellenica]|uniref:TetR/AcrR family transcriptional regulator n=1 Tax=Plastoroseomonas hellenica TaxID=2687306 RepID=A0ABS5EYR0_9PROT|nr:TetR/AcrR family transcriptional regulator [Plastoroseomonas hellenica]MBR0665436.1 TetR/AcrR family transcriptional regulator [Plastoroseomonas hellenica]